MIKIIALLASILFVFTACNENEQTTNKESIDNTSIEQEIKDIPEDKVMVIVYDSCEYIIFKEHKTANLGYGFMAHKGNCSNPVHVCK